MSNDLALATVTETLLQMLLPAVHDVIHGATVKTLPLDKATAEPGVFVNIFLYQIAPNAALRNADLPTRGADRHVMQRPCAVIDLHYLLTMHGNDNIYEPQKLLGAVVRTLHSTP